MTVLHEIDCAATAHAPPTLYRLLDVGEDQLIVQARVRCANACIPISLILAQVSKDRANPRLMIATPLGLEAVRTICRLIMN